MKDTNPATARASSSESLCEPTHPDTLTLDVTRLSAKEAALRIVQYSEERNQKRTPE